MRSSDWDVVCVRPDRVFIIDLDLGNISVTNDAEAVWWDVQKMHFGRRVIYRDSMGQWDEICMTDTGSVLFRPYKEALPLECGLR